MSRAGQKLLAAAREGIAAARMGTMEGASMNRCIAAFTAPGGSFPAYINASEQPDGQVMVMVRSAPETSGGAAVNGAVASIDMPPGAWFAFIKEAVLAMTPDEQAQVFLAVVEAAQKRKLNS